MDFNQIYISNSPMYALPVKQLSAKSKHLTSTAIMVHNKGNFEKVIGHNFFKLSEHSYINMVCVPAILCKSFVCGLCYENNQPTV